MENQGPAFFVPFEGLLIPLSAGFRLSNSDTSDVIFQNQLPKCLSHFYKYKFERKHKWSRCGCKIRVKIETHDSPLPLTSQPHTHIHTHSKCKPNNAKPTSSAPFHEVFTFPHKAHRPPAVWWHQSFSAIQVDQPS